MRPQTRSAAPRAGRLGAACAIAAAVVAGWLAAAGAQQPPSEPPGGDATTGAPAPPPSEALRTPTLYVELRGADGSFVDASSQPPCSVLEQGVPRPILEAQPLAASDAGWSVLIYADLPLSTPAALAAAADALAASAERLVALGEVDVVVASTAARSLFETAESSPDAASLRSALAELARRSAEAGELARRRERLREAAAEAEDASELARLLAEHRYEEDELRGWQQDLLEDWLFGVAEDELPPVAERPRLLVLLRDALDESADAFLNELDEDAAASAPADTSVLRVQRQRIFARTAASLGWIAIPLRIDAAATHDAGEPDAELADATGGALVRNASALGAELEALGHRWRIRYTTTSTSGEPTPVDVRPANAELRARSPRWVSGLLPEMLAAVHARRLLEDGEEGALEVEAVVVDQPGPAALLEAAVAPPQPLAGAAAARSDRLRVTVVSQRLDHDPELLRLRGGGVELSGARWILQTEVRTPEDLQDVVVVVEDLATGAWGAAFAEPSETTLSRDSPTAIVEMPNAPAAPATAPPPPIAPARPAPADPTQADVAGSELDPRTHALPDRDRPPVRARARSGAFQLVPPRGRELTGPQEFAVLLSSEGIRRVEFHLDGELAADDTRRPFSARLDLGPQVREHEVRALAFSRDGVVLGEDVLRVNAPRAATGLRLTEVTPVPGSDQVDAVAELALPPSARLDRVELFRNETLGATLTKPPWRARLPGPARVDADYVRAVAYLADGTELEDVWLMGSGAAVSERVEVNLVEVYAVVTDADGNVVDGLVQDDFELRLGKERVAIERFALADEVPLVVGLAIDTSSSMWTLMPDTRNAASRFLGQVLRKGDRGFVVEFSDRPRLSHAESGDPIELMRSIGRLQAGGATALYDAVVFSLLQFEPGLGRKAIVLLTDGEDYNSRFSYRRTHRTAAQAGLPVYFVVLGGLDDERPVFRKDDLELIADLSGGRVFYVRGMGDIYDAYERIGKELRSQYVVAFSTPEPLADDELERVKLTVEGPKRQVRFAVGRQ